MQLPGIYVEIKGDYSHLQQQLKAARAVVSEQATGISNALNNALSPDKIKGSINAVVSSFSTLARASAVAGNAFDSIGVDLGELRQVTGLTEKQLAKLQSQLLKTQASNAQENALKRIASACNLTEKEIRSLGRQFGLSSDQISKVVGSSQKAERSLLSMGNVARTALAYFSVQAVAGMARSLVETADKYTLLENRLRLVTDGSESLKNIQEQLYASANRVRSSYESQADLYVRTARSMADYNITQQQTLAYSEAISRSMVISGASIQEAASFAIQFSQAMQKGNLNDDEFKAVMESNGRAVKVLTDYLTFLNKGIPVTAGDLRKLSSEGKLTAAVLYNAFSHSQGQLENEFNSMAKTVGQSATHFKNAFGSLVDGTNDATGATGSLAKSIDGLAATVEANKKEVVAFFEGITTAAGWAVEAVAGITTEVKVLSAVAAGELDFSRYISMGVPEMKSFLADYETGLAQATKKATDSALKLKKLREADIPDDQALTSATKEFEAANKELEALKKKKQEVAAIGIIGGSPAMGKVSGTVSPEETKKLQKQIEDAYKSAYNVIGGTSKEVYAAMKKQYEADRDEFIRITGDKVTAQKVYNEQIKKLTEDKKGSGKALKAEREELKQLNAGIKSYVNLADDAAKAASKWLSVTSRVTSDMENLVDQFATAGMSDFEVSLHDQERATKAAQAALEGYGGALDTIDGKLAETTAAYEIASAQLEQMQAKLDSNSAGSDTQDLNALDSLKSQVDELLASIKALNAEKVNLEKLKKGASTLKGDIAEMYRLDDIKNMYGQVGAYTTEIYDTLKQQYIADSVAYVRATGDKIAANKAFEQNMRELDLNNPNVSWGRAAQIGFEDVADWADDMGKDIADSVEDAFDRASDALTDFILEGKDGFKDLVQSIAADFTNMFIRNQMMAPLAGMLGGMLFGGGANYAGAASDVSNLVGTSGLFHTGGLVGSGEGGTMEVSPMIFDSAPRFHNGLKPDEFPAILQKGEGVFTKGQMQAMGMLMDRQPKASSGGELNINVPVSISNGSKKLSAELQRAMERTALEVVRRHS